MHDTRRRQRIEEALRTRLQAVHVEVVDDSARHVGHPGARGGGHFNAVVVSQRFAGLSRVDAQRLVYEALRDEMVTDIHALQLKTLTPEAWQAGKRPHRG